MFDSLREEEEGFGGRLSPSRFDSVAALTWGTTINPMRYLVKARIKPGQEKALLQAIEQGRLGQGSVAGDEYLRNMAEARTSGDTARWVEVCYCDTPLAEERPYWEEYFELLDVKDAHPRSKCRDLNGTEPWACSDCDCTKRLEGKLRERGKPFVETLHENSER
jgi:hypothetical protein